MKIVFLTTLAGRETYLAGDLVEYPNPYEAYRLIEAKIARPPTRAECYSIDAREQQRTTEALAIMAAEEAAKLEAAKLEAAAKELARAEAELKRIEAVNRARAANRLRLESHRADRHHACKVRRAANAERRAHLGYRDTIRKRGRAADQARVERRAHYVAHIKAAQAAEDAAALEAVAGAVKAHRPRARRHFLTRDERLVIRQLYEQEKTTHRALAECYEVSTQTIFKTLHETR